MNKEINKILKRVRNDVDLPFTLLVNIPTIWWGTVYVAYTALCLGAVERLNVADPLIKLPLIIIVAFSAIQLMSRYRPQVEVIYKKR